MARELKVWKLSRCHCKFPKAISVQAISPSKFLVLDSDGDLHQLFISNSVHGSEVSYYIKQPNLRFLLCTNLFAKFIICLSTISSNFINVALRCACASANIVCSQMFYFIELLLCIRLIFYFLHVCEMIQQIMPLAVDAVLILGQGMQGLKFLTSCLAPCYCRNILSIIVLYWFAIF